MIEYINVPDSVVEISTGRIATFTSFKGETNVDHKVVEDFGVEWMKFNAFEPQELEKIGRDYFDILFESGIINNNTIVLDAGCGTGRWSKVLCEKVKLIEAIDPSSAVFSAQRLLKNEKNIRVTRANIDTIPFADCTFDLVMSIGVLHHIPDTEKALTKLVKKIKKGGYFYGYLYYNFENRNALFKMFFFISNHFRKGISKLPSTIKKRVCDFIALTVYFTCAKFTRLIKWAFKNKSIYQNIPLSYYYDKSLMIMRNDALDRFGTRLEKRYSRSDIVELTQKCGLTNIKFSNKEPYWHFTAQKQ
jgi:SAM-dependent methyltransferase